MRTSDAVYLARNESQSCPAVRPGKKTVSVTRKVLRTRTVFRGTRTTTIAVIAGARKRDLFALGGSESLFEPEVVEPMDAIEPHSSEAVSEQRYSLYASNICGSCGCSAFDKGWRRAGFLSEARSSQDKDDL
jgi:hypothetical protein